jgi:hypothetical protein
MPITPKTGSLFHAETHDGFAYGGKTFAGLSEIATAITGTRWNGPRFFGLRSAAGREEPDGE